MWTLKFLHGVLQASREPTCRTWSSKRGCYSGSYFSHFLSSSQAAIQASKEHATEVTLKHFEWAKDRILMGAEGKSRYIDPKNKLATAYHEVRVVLIWLRGIADPP